MGIIFRKNIPIIDRTRLEGKEMLSGSLKTAVRIFAAVASLLFYAALASETEKTSQSALVDANIRKNASSQSEVVGVVKRGQTIVVTFQDSEWAAVYSSPDARTPRGYVKRKLLTNDTQAEIKSKTNSDTEKANGEKNNESSGFWGKLFWFCLAIWLISISSKKKKSEPSQAAKPMLNKNVEHKNFENKNDDEYYYEPKQTRKTLKPIWFGKGSSLNVGGILVTDPYIFFSEQHDYSLPYWCLTAPAAHRSDSTVQCSETHENDFPDNRLQQELNDFFEWLSSERFTRFDQENFRKVFRNHEVRILKDKELDALDELERYFDAYFHQNEVAVPIIDLVAFSHAFLQRPIPIGWQERLHKLAGRLHESIAIDLAIDACESDIPLPLLYARTSAVPEAYRGTIVQRLRDEHQALFFIRAKEANFPKAISRPNRTRNYSYYSCLGERKIKASDTEVWDRRLKEAVQIWNSCALELKSLSRIRNKTELRSTAQDYISIPKPLRALYTHEFKAKFDDFVGNQLKIDETPYVSVEMLGALLLSSNLQLQRLTPNRSNHLVKLIEEMGFCPEPNYQELGINYDSNQKILLLKSNNPSSTKLTVAKIMLMAGMAKGGLELNEAQSMDYTKLITNVLSLSDKEFESLLLLREIVKISPPELKSVFKRVRELFSENERRQLGMLFISSAMSDGHLSTRERAVVKRIYSLMDLDEAELSQALHEMHANESDVPLVRVGRESERGEPIPKLPGKVFAKIELSDALLNRLWEETKAVQSQLSNLEESNEDEEELILAKIRPVIGEIKVSKFKGLSARFVPVLEELIDRKSLTEDEFRLILSKNGNLMRGAAVESINEWSFENFDDSLIEEGAEVGINQTIAARIRSRAA